MKALEAFLPSDQVCELLISGSHAILRAFDGTVIAWTEGASQLYGWSKAEALGCSSHRLLQTVFPAPLATIQAELRAKAHWMGELIHQCKDGTTIVVQSSWRLVLGHDGASYVIEINNDITELAVARRRLTESESRLRLAKEVANLAIWDWNVLMDETICSPEWFAQHGRDPQSEAPTSAQWMSWIHPDDRARVVQAINAATDSGSTYEAELRVIWPDDSVHWLHTRAHPVLNDLGTCVRLIGANLDITDRKEFETRLHNINCSLRQYNDDLEQFAYAAGHDLKEPLRTMSAAAGMIARRLNSGLDPETTQFLAYLEDGAARMQKMIDSLLEYAQTAHQSMALEKMPAQSLVSNALTNLRAAIDESGAEIVVGPLPEIYANPVVLTQVFQNLISNAIKYRKPGVQPFVRVSASQSDEHWAFSISDNGLGFPPRQSEAIFRLFKRLEHSNVPGAGVGLSVCKRIVEKHGGRMWAESIPGQGSTFYFSIPISNRRAQVA